MIHLPYKIVTDTRQCFVLCHHERSATFSSEQAVESFECAHSADNSLKKNDLQH